MITEFALGVFNGMAAGSGQAEVFIGADGLRHCSKCGEPVERKAELFGNPVSVPMACRCRAKELTERAEKEAMRQREDRVREIRRKSTISGDYAKASFTNYVRKEENLQALKIASRYCAHFDEMCRNGQGLLLYGSVGTGKTYTAACIANWLMGKEHTVIMTSPARILREVWDTSISETENLEKLMRPELLIIDDLGTERNTDYGFEKLFSVIDMRVTSKRPMIITTNLTRREMMEADLKHQRIYDRMLSVCYPVQITGRSFRMAEAERRQKEMIELLEGDSNGK